MSHAFSARWKLVSSENFENYMKATGVSAENIAKGLQVLEKTGDGGLEEEYVVDTAANTIKRIIYLGGQVQKESPPVPAGKEVEGPGLDGRVLKFTLTLEGNNKAVRLEKGPSHETKTVFEIAGNSMTATLTCGGVTCVRKYTKA